MTEHRLPPVKRGRSVGAKINAICFAGDRSLHRRKRRGIRPAKFEFETTRKLPSHQLLALHLRTPLKPLTTSGTHHPLPDHLLEERDRNPHAHNQRLPFGLTFESLHDRVHRLFR